MKPIFKQTLTQADFLLIAANLLPVYGVWFLGWDPLEAFIAYALETVVVGVFTLIKLGIQWVHRRRDYWHNDNKKTLVSGLFFMLFFCFHYGMFVTVQMVIFVQASGLGSSNEFWAVFKSTDKFLNSHIAIMLCGFIAHHGFRLVNDFIRTDAYKKLPLMQVMFQPYGRIFVQQFTVIFGAMFLTLGVGKVFVLVFIVAKLIFELKFDFEAIIQKSFDKANARSGE